MALLSPEPITPVLDPMNTPFFPEIKPILLDQKQSAPTTQPVLPSISTITTALTKPTQHAAPTTSTPLVTSDRNSNIDMAMRRSIFEAAVSLLTLTTAKRRESVSHQPQLQPQWA
eukprot:GEZU01030800.1.p1 GENE.GEZU01030800.1~~GEZU01030800.1.p1  ORF type:complete len:115 (-),score=19.38 GEZU01030800.1:120-464(-)